MVFFFFFFSQCEMFMETTLIWACPNTDNVPCLFLKDLVIACADRISLTCKWITPTCFWTRASWGCPLKAQLTADTVFMKYWISIMVFLMNMVWIYFHTSYTNIEKYFNCCHPSSPPADFWPISFVCYCWKTGIELHERTLRWAEGRYPSGRHHLTDSCAVLFPLKNGSIFLINSGLMFALISFLCGATFWTPITFCVLGGKSCTCGYLCLHICLLSQFTMVATHSWRRKQG